MFHNQGIRNVQLPPPEKVHVLGLVVALYFLVELRLNTLGRNLYERERRKERDGD